MKWYRAVFYDAKTHFFPGVIKNEVLGSLAERGCRLYKDFPLGGNIAEVTEVGVSLGMPCQADIEFFEFELPGAQFVVEAREVGIFLHELSELAERDDIGTKYYKIHGRLHCVCLLPAHREQLIALMETRLSEANAIAEIENREFNEGLDKALKGRPSLISERPVSQIEEG